MKKQTAVDMFCLTISDHIEAIFNGSIQQDEFAKRMRQSYNQALTIEKEQIMDAAKIMLEGKIILFNSTEIGDRRAEQYYNKIFKQQ